MAKQQFRQGPNGPYPITPRKGGGAKLFVGAVAVVSVVGVGSAAGLGGAGIEAETVAEA
jgi:hypothetical protein